MNKEEILLSWGFYRSSRSLSVNKRKRKYTDLSWELKKMLWNGDGGIKNNRSTCNDPHGPGKKTWGTGDQMENREHPDDSIVMIGYNTQKSSGDLERPAVTHSRGISLLWKTHIKRNHRKTHYRHPYLFFFFNVIKLCTRKCKEGYRFTKTQDNMPLGHRFY